MIPVLRVAIAVTAGAGLLHGASTKAATFTTLYSFAPTDMGYFPTGDLVIDAAGNIIGTTSIGSQSGTIFRYAPGSQTTTFLYSFTGDDGSIPQGSLVLKGNILFGTTASGGVDNAGTIYRLDLSSLALQTLHKFDGPADGASPYGGLTSYDGSLFGVDLTAGAFNGGALYVASPSAAPSYLPKFEALHAFDKGRTGAEAPIGDVAIDAAGVVYGVTEAYAGKRSGTLYSYDLASKRLRILHEFTDKSTGSFPFAGVTLFGNSVYGTTYFGGEHNKGTVWTYDLAARTFAVIHSFAGSADGQAPQARLAITRSGLLYGTAYAGGTYGYGTVFTMDLRIGTFAVLHDFESADGQYPLAGVVVGKDGTIYGTTSLGGDGLGTLYSIAQ